MKDWLKLAGVVFFVLFVISLPFLFYGSIAYVVVHFIKKFW